MTFSTLNSIQAAMERAGRLAGQAAKALSRQTKGAAFVGAYAPLPGGARGLAWAADKITAQDVEMFAIALLERVRDESAHGAMGCPTCAARADRATEALAALKPDLRRPSGACH